MRSMMAVWLFLVATATQAQTFQISSSYETLQRNQQVLQLERSFREKPPSRFEQTLRAEIDREVLQFDDFNAQAGFHYFRLREQHPHAYRTEHREHYEEQIRRAENSILRRPLSRAVVDGVRQFRRLRNRGQAYKERAEEQTTTTAGGFDLGLRFFDNGLVSASLHYDGKHGHLEVLVPPDGEKPEITFNTSIRKTDLFAGFKQDRHDRKYTFGARLRW